MRYSKVSGKFRPDSWSALVFLLLLFSFFFFACASAPKPTGDIIADRSLAAAQINLANQALSRGQYDSAMKIMEEARRLAVSVDDPSLRLKTSVGMGDILFSMGRHDEAFAEWENAVYEGEASGETALVAYARICVARAKLVLGTGDAEVLRTQINATIDVFKDDEISQAIAYITLGLAEKALGNWDKAENAVKQALAIHEKNLRLEDAAYDWYLIASIRSVKGDYDGALEALDTAIGLDRRAENGFGLASSWQAKGDVNQKAGKAKDAEAAWRRAAEIYKAIGLIDQAKELESRF